MEVDVEECYIRAPRRMYEGQKAQVVADKKSRWFPVARGAEQGDPISPALFNTVLEILVRKLKEKWGSERKGIKMVSAWKIFPQMR